MRIGIDLGGTKIEGIVLDADGGEKARLRIDTPEGSYEAGVQAIVNTADVTDSRAMEQLAQRAVDAFGHHVTTGSICA